jgi:hypothetical protein
LAAVETQNPDGERTISLKDIPPDDAVESNLERLASITLMLENPGTIYGEDNAIFPGVANDPSVLPEPVRIVVIVLFAEFILSILLLLESTTYIFLFGSTAIPYRIENGNTGAWENVAVFVGFRVDTVSFAIVRTEFESVTYKLPLESISISNRARKADTRR